MARVLGAGSILLSIAVACSLTNGLDDLQNTTAKNDDDGGPAPCNSGRASCDGNPANGCEVDLQTHAGNCGACGNACPPAPNATPACLAGKCGFSCQAFTDDCDGDASNGCEAPVEKDLLNCGACGHVCGTQNTESTECLLGKCKPVCSPGFADCDLNDANGCEADLSAPTTCGKCGTNCLEGGCTAGKCTPVTLGKVSDPSALAVGDRVWVGRNTTTCGSTSCTTVRDLVSLPKAGGTVTTVVANSGEVRAIVVAASDVFYTSSSGVLRLTNGAAPPVTLSTAGSEGLAVDATDVFYTRNGNLFTVPRAGGTSVELVHNDVGNAVVEDAGNLFFAFKTTTEGVHRMSSAGGTPLLLTDAKNVRSLAVAGGFLFWSEDNNPGRVRKVAVTGGVGSDLAVQQPVPTTVVADATHLYWWTRNDSSLRRATFDGTAETLVAGSGSGEATLALDAEYVYWAEANSDTVRKLAK